MYTSGDEVNGFYDDYLSRTNETKKEFSITDAISIGLQPKCKGLCWICPLGCIFVPSKHNCSIQEIHKKLSLIANRGIHPIFNRGPLHGANPTAETLQKIVFELSPDKIYSLKSATNNATSEILSTLEFISMNIIPPEVKTFVRLCDPKRITYNSCTLDTFPEDLRKFKKKDKMFNAKACD